MLIIQFHSLEKLLIIQVHSSKNCCGYFHNSLVLKIGAKKLLSNSRMWQKEIFIKSHSMEKKIFCSFYKNSQSMNLHETV